MYFSGIVECISMILEIIFPISHLRTQTVEGKNRPRGDRNCKESFSKSAFLISCKIYFSVIVECISMILEIIFPISHLRIQTVEGKNWPRGDRNLHYWCRHPWTGGL